MTDGERPSAWSERKGESFTITPERQWRGLSAAAGRCRCRKSRRAAPMSETEAYAGTETGDRARRRADRRDARYGDCPVRRRSQPEHGLSHFAGDGLPDDAVQRAARRLAAQPGDRFDDRTCRARPPNALVDAGSRADGTVERLKAAQSISATADTSRISAFTRWFADVADTSWSSMPAPIPMRDFADLGNAVLKIRVDLDVEINFEPPIAIGSRSNPTQAVPLVCLRQDPLSGGRQRASCCMSNRLTCRTCRWMSAPIAMPTTPFRTSPRSISSSARASSRAIASLVLPRCMTSPSTPDSFDALFKRARDKLRQTKLNSDAAAK